MIRCIHFYYAGRIKSLFERNIFWENEQKKKKLYNRFVYKQIRLFGYIHYNNRYTFNFNNVRQSMHYIPFVIII